jgi:DNA-binding CsgD family transcriptional regulator
VRERQVLQGVSYGLSNPAIGRHLHLSEATVKTHAASLFRKLGARDRAHATRIGLELGLLTASAPLRPAPPPRWGGHPDAVPGFPVPTDWLPVPIPERPYAEGGHTPACILAPQCPCRREQAVSR